MKDPTLYNGKIGIAIAFFEYGRYKKEDACIDFADNLLNDFLSYVDNGIPYTFAYGASGISWGIEYLMQKGFISIDCSHTCEDLDQIIIRTDLRRLPDLSIEKGIEGLLHYILMRLKGASCRQETIPFDYSYLMKMEQVLLSLQPNRVTINMKQLINSFLTYMSTHNIQYNVDIHSLYSSINVTDFDFYTFHIGLNNGLSGKLLDIVYAIEKNELI